MVFLMLFSTFASIHFSAWEVMALNDSDGDGLSYAQEYLLNTQPTDPDTDGDGLPDGWEWKYGLDPLDATAASDNGAAGDPDGDGLANLLEYRINIPTNWDSAATTTVLDNGVWWNGTIPVRGWSEEHVQTLNTPACGTTGNDGASGTVILCDEDPIGDICNDGIDNDGDGFLDSADSDNDGDAICGSNDDDGDGVDDEDPDGWDSDNDGMPDGWEYANNLDPTSASGNDGAGGDPDNDNLTNLYEYINPGWDSECGNIPCFQPGPGSGATATITPCNPSLGFGPASDPSCSSTTASVDSITETDPNRADTDRDGLKDGDEAWTYRTDPTSQDTDNDGISDGIEVASGYGNPSQASNPLSNNTDGDQFDDGDEDINGNGLMDVGETDPTRREDAGDFDNDGIENWEENNSCTLWDVADTDHGGVIDGAELDNNHSTNPCDSVAPFSTTSSGYSSQRLTVADPSGFNPNGGIGRYNVSGAYTDFAYSSLQGNVLRGVATAPPLGTQSVESWNASFCHTNAIALGLKTSTLFYCDDDYEDSDKDGLANWEEITGAYGFTSSMGLVDTDSDGESDYAEVMNGTDPNNPCVNSLDTDLDGLNDYFETSTGCALSWIEIGNMSLDTYQTDPTIIDTDGGLVDDRTEYFDSTNPENDPSDDLLPDDFDGDGVPDEIENLTGTDWRDPDTDGGGMSDGLECPKQFWRTQCSGSGFDPLDPSDDIVQNQVIFTAENTTGIVDPLQPHYWRQYTYDNYTGISYGAVATEHPAADISIPFGNNSSLLPALAFQNGSVIWDINFQTPYTSGPIPVPANLQNITSIQDFSVSLTGTDLWRMDIVDGSGALSSMTALQPEVFYSNAVQSITIGMPGMAHETTIDSELNNSASSSSFARNVTNGVIAEAGATNAYSIAAAIADFLMNGNSSTNFILDGNGSKPGGAPDLANHILLTNQSASCSEYSTVFVTMARLAGLPARKVSGYSGGIWNGSGYTVMSENSAYWGEVRLQTNAAGGNLDLGWVPFNPCPKAEILEVINDTWSPSAWDRDQSVDIELTGVLRFQENQTEAAGVMLTAYLIPANETSLVPGPAATQGRVIGTGMTAANGSFSISGSPLEAIHSGFQKIVYVPDSEGIIWSQLIEPAWFINITDDVNITHLDAPINNPSLGAGSPTSLSGIISYENLLDLDISQLANHTLYLNYTTVVDGVISQQTTLGLGGAWEFIVSMKPNEPFGNISATVEFPGWMSTEQSFTGTTDHLRTNSLVMIFAVEAAPNITATLEGPKSNSSRLVVDSTVWVNGTAQTVATPTTPLTGDLEIAIREAGTNARYEVMANLSVSGNYNTTFVLDRAFVQNIPAGAIELRVKFHPNNLNSTTVANLSAVDHWMVGRMNISFDAGTHARGNQVSYTMTVADHRGQTPENVVGTYINSFDGSVENTTVDPQTAQFSVLFSSSSSLVAGDYIWETAFGGSDWFEADTFNTSVRIQGEAGFNPTNPNLVDDWTHLGDKNWVTGDLFDPGQSTVITGNNSTVNAGFMHPINGFTIVGTSYVNTTTGAINITITAPTDVGSSVKGLIFEFIFAQVNGTHDNEPYFMYTDEFVTGENPPPPLETPWGIESESRLTFENSSYITQVNQSVDLTVFVDDIADGSNISSASIEYIFDWNGANVSLGTVLSNATGYAVFPFIPDGIAPGKYELRAVMADDISDTLTTPEASRWLGNSTLSEITIQVGTSIDAIFPSVVTAGLRFNLTGTVLDADNSSRPLSSAVQMNVFWSDNPDEILVNGASTAANGSFSLSVPTDTASNGTERGDHILVLQVVNESNPFYLFGATQSSILVMGVTIIEDADPRDAAVVLRGSDIDLSATLKESSNVYQALPGETVAILFDDTWLAEQTTDGAGAFAMTHTIPNDQPLGLISITFVFNQTVDLLASVKVLNTITISTTTVSTLDAITANPVAADSFNISGNVVSDNGSGIINRDGSVLTHIIQFKVDGDISGFSVSGGLLQVDGSWNATVSLNSDFKRGLHNLTAVFVPSGGAPYMTSEDTKDFTSKGFSTLLFINPTMNNGNPTLASATIRNQTLLVQLSLIENTNEPVSGQTITVNLTGTSTTIFATTDSNGIAWANFTLPEDLTPGLNMLTAEYAGINQPDGLLGSSTNVSFIALANTIITIDEYTSSLVVNQDFYLNGSLFDDIGLPLMMDGENFSGVVYLVIDGNTTMSVQSNNSTGSFAFIWQVPQSFGAGNHTVEVRFTGDPAWSNPGSSQANAANPPYYMPSSDNDTFSVLVPTSITLTSAGGSVDRGDTIWLNGTLADIISIGLGNRDLVVNLNSNFYTTASTDINGVFTIPIIIPKETPLGPADIQVVFGGEQFYLSSDANATWILFSPITITITTDESVAINENLSISGTIVDNNLDAVPFHSVLLEVDGMVIAQSVITDENGSFNLSWLAQGLGIGEHLLTAYVNEHGYYREGSANTTFYVAHRTAFSASFSSASANTRGQNWVLEGRLFDNDSISREGIAYTLIEISLDGIQVESTTTGDDGYWTISVDISTDATRGMHNLTVFYSGNQTLMPSNTTLVGTALAQVLVDVVVISQEVIRGDSLYPVTLEGRLIEGGGNQSVISNAELSIDTICGVSGLEACEIQWKTDGSFVISGVVGFDHEPGTVYLIISYPGNSTQYFQSANTTIPLELQVDLEFEVEFKNLVPGSQDSVEGTVTIFDKNARAQGIDMRVEGIPITAILTSEGTNNSAYSVQTQVSDTSGTVYFEFKADPDYSDSNYWGLVSLELQIDDYRVSEDSISAFRTAHSNQGQIPVEEPPVEEETPIWMYAAGGALVAAGIGAYVFWKRREDAIKELSEIFSYTAELLAAGDEMREAIYMCYENLCQALMKHGYLRRDFETIREFEMGIRKALPIKETSLMNLDQVFEEARYSAHEMTDRHKQFAQESLLGVLNDIDNMERVSVPA
jgi:hypothetical protein